MPFSIASGVAPDLFRRDYPHIVSYRAVDSRVTKHNSYAFCPRKCPHSSFCCWLFHNDRERNRCQSTSPYSRLYGSWPPTALESAMPSWARKLTEDHMIAPELQRFISKRAGSKVVEIKGSHAIYVSRPDAVATLIEKAAKGAPLVAARQFVERAPDNFSPGTSLAQVSHPSL